MSHVVDMTGRVLGPWRVLRRGPALESAPRHAAWWCEAVCCGRVALVSGIRNGRDGRGRPVYKSAKRTQPMKARRKPSA